jgi:hypothetical protein
LETAPDAQAKKALPAPRQCVEPLAEFFVSMAATAILSPRKRWGLFSGDGGAEAGVAELLNWKLRARRVP